LAIFVDGCFWHACPKCFRRPLSNQKFWDAKMRRNRKRDRVVTHKLQSARWRVLRIWHHELRDGNAVAARLLKALRPPLRVPPPPSTSPRPPNA
jgi:DNA mismatch endonuclease (patch repair protein)